MTRTPQGTVRSLPSTSLRYLEWRRRENAMQRETPEGMDPHYQDRKVEVIASSKTTVN